MEEGMSKISDSALIGFSLGGTVGFILIFGAVAEADNEDVANYAFLCGLIVSPFAGILGAVILSAIGEAIEKSGRNSSPRHCQHCRLPVVGNPKTCRWCGVDLQSL
jgi:hypothetical protein